MDKLWERTRYPRRDHLQMKACFLACTLGLAGFHAQGAVQGKNTPMVNAEAIKDSLVQISDDGPVGIGFIAEMDGKQYIVTTASTITGHNKLAFKTLSGKPLQPARIELSATRDLARLQVAGASALKINFDMQAKEKVVVLEYQQGSSIDEYDGTISDIGKDMIDLTIEFEEVCGGSPMLNKAMEVGGVATYISYYKSSNKSWSGTTRRFAGKLDAAEWYAPDWKQYNETFGRHLRDADLFRTRIYGITNEWIASPKKSIALDDDASRDFSRWLKMHNDLVSDLSKKGSSKEKLNDIIRNKFKGNCDELIKICTDKSSQLEFLGSNKNITPYLRKQFAWRAGELKSYAAFIQAHSKKMAKEVWI